MSLPEIYTDTIERVAVLAESLTPAQADVIVPATPEWTVHDLLAHLSGSTRDVVTGRVDGQPGRAWTNRQVQERRGVSVSELAAELREQSALLPQEVLLDPGPGPLWDLIVHEADLREALGLDPAPEVTVRTLLPLAVGTLGLQPGTRGVEITTVDGVWRVGAPVQRVVLAADDAELLRVLFSRRSTERIARTIGPGSDTGAVEALESLAFFGPRAS